MRIKGSQIQLVCVLYLVAWMIAPPLAYDTIYRLLAIIAAGIWVLVQVLMKRAVVVSETKKHVKLYLVCVCIYALVLLVFRCVFEHMSIGSSFYYNITTYILLFIGYVGGVYHREGRYKDIKIIFYFVLVIAVVFSVTSIFRDEAFYELTRNAGGDTSEEYEILAREAAKQGVGAFGFFCFSSVFAPMILWNSYEQSTRKKVIFRIAFLVVELGVLSAGYTLALLISLVGCVCCLVLKMRSLTGKTVIVISAILLVVFWDDLSYVLYAFLQKISSGTMYETKVEDIFSFLIDGESSGTFEARQERYMLSLQAIFKYPLFGSYLWAGVREIGSHSSILDTFAAYGWIVGSVWLYIITVYPCKLLRSYDKGYKLTFFLLLFLTAVFNTYTMMMGVFYFLVPIGSLFFNDKNRGDEVSL